MNKEIINKIKIIISDKGYDSEGNHVIAKRHDLQAIIPVRNKDVLIYLKERIGRGLKGICQKSTKGGQ